MAPAIRRALSEAEGSLLAFLPGVAEIERTAERLEILPPGVDLHRLHGTLDPQAQRAAIAASPPGRRKIVLATSIAETSLTLDGVRIVIDSGLARRPRYDRSAGLTRLVTERASQASVTQRAGRAGRQGPGTVYRLWEEAATLSLPRFDPPEILETDLSALLLDCALWGVADPRELKWIDPPPAAAVEEARKRLVELGALDVSGRPTNHGKATAALPLPPRLAHMLLEAAGRGWGETAADLAVLLSERGLGGDDTDLETRLRRWRSERGKRAEAARGLARNWLKLTRHSRGSRSPASSAKNKEEQNLDARFRGNDALVGNCVALAFPGRLSRRRDSLGENWISAGGRGFRLDPLSPLAKEQWLAVAEVAGTAGGARILSAAAIDEAMVEELFRDRIGSGTQLSFDAATGSVVAKSGRRLGAITLSEGRDAKASPQAIVAALLEGVRTHGLDLLPGSQAALAFRKRAAFVRRFDATLPDLSDQALLASLDEWLPLLLAGKRKLGDIDCNALTGTLEGMLGWDGRSTLDRLAPAQFGTPAGSRHAIDYGAEAGPTVTTRVQALFGLKNHPSIADGAVPLVLSLTSPAGRTIQTTRDLPGFWAGSWSAVAKEMRGRYPKHPWPDDPASADATLLVKKARS